MGQPVALLDLREIRRLRSGAARAARRHVRQIRRGDRPGRAAELRRLSLHARGRRRRPRRPTSIRRSRPAGSRPGRFQNYGAAGLVAARQGDRARLRQGRRPTASRSAPNSPRTIRRCWCWTASSRPSRSIRCFSSRNAASPGTTRTAAKLELVLGVQSPYEAAESIAYLLGKAQRAVQAGAHQRPVRLCRRRLRRPRPHAVPALRRAGGDVLSRPSGPAGARPLSAVSGRHQAPRRSRCARGSASTAPPARSRLSPPTMCWMAAASPIFRPTSRPSAPPPRSASTTFRRSTSPRWRCIRAA